MTVIERQSQEKLVETIVVPDRKLESFDAAFTAYGNAWQGSAIRLENFGPVESHLAARVSGHTRHWMQLVKGVSAAKSSHIVLHDADAFIWHPDFFNTLYQRCAGEKLACVGVSRLWNHEYYEARGYDHLNATWELMMDADWARRWPPPDHLGHVGDLNGEPNTFDTFVSAQTETNKELTARLELANDYVHFNYVTCNYRNYQMCNGTFEDTEFRLLLLRLLVDALDDSDYLYDLPDLKELTMGLSDGSGRISYTHADARQKYAPFRTKLESLLCSGLLTTEQVAIVRHSLQQFDAKFC